MIDPTQLMQALRRSWKPHKITYNSLNNTHDSLPQILNNPTLLVIALSLSHYWASPPAPHYWCWTSRVLTIPHPQILPTAHITTLLMIAPPPPPHNWAPYSHTTAHPSPHYCRHCAWGENNNNWWTLPTRRSIDVETNLLALVSCDIVNTVRMWPGLIGCQSFSFRSQASISPLEKEKYLCKYLINFA